jgi:HEAT repeat protein
MGIRDMTQVHEMKVRGDILGLIRVLVDSEMSAPARRFSAAALGELRDRRAVEPLVSVLDDSDLCAEAIEALGTIGDPLAAAPLVELMYAPPNRAIKKTAEHALKKLNARDPQGVRKVLERYDRHVARGRNRQRRGGRQQI